MQQPTPRWQNYSKETLEKSRSFYHLSQSTGLVVINIKKNLLGQHELPYLLPINTSTVIIPARRARIIIQQDSLQHLLSFLVLVLVTYSFSPLQ